MAICCGQTNVSGHLRFGVLSCRTLAFHGSSRSRARLGDTVAARAGAVRSTIAAGIPLAIGSDGVTNLMFATINAATPGEALTLEQALGAYTRGSAISERQEANKGTLEVGTLADLAVLSQDIFKVHRASCHPRTVSSPSSADGLSTSRNEG